MISSELQYFAFSNPIQVVTVAKVESSPTCRVDKPPHYVITPMHCIDGSGMVINGSPVPLRPGDGAYVKLEGWPGEAHSLECLGPGSCCLPG